MKPAPRVLRLTPHFYWPQLETTGWPVRFDAIGGMQTQIFRIASALADEHLEQEVLTLKIPGAPRVWQMRDRLVIRGVRVPVFPVRSRVRGMVDLNLSWMLGVLRELCVRPRKVQIVHAHCSGVIWPLLAGWAAARLLRAKLILTIHCSILGTYHHMCVLDVINGPSARLIEKTVLRRADAIIVLTCGQASKLEDLLPELRGRLHVVPDAIDLESFRNLGPAGDRRRYLPTETRQSRFIIGYVGRIAREKGWTCLVRLAALLRDEPVHFLICGDGNEFDLLKAAIEREGLQSMFTLTGYIPQAAVPDAFNQCDVLVLPSKHEEFGSVILEALAMGVPVIAFAVGGVPDIVRDGETAVLVDPGDESAMAAAILKLKDDCALCERIASNGLAWVRARYSLRAAADALLLLYRQTLGRGNEEA